MDEMSETPALRMKVGLVVDPFTSGRDPIDRMPSRSAPSAKILIRSLSSLCTEHRGGRAGEDACGGG
jgi:hypothetical protein